MNIGYAIVKYSYSTKEKVMIEFNTITDPKVRCQISMQIKEFNKRSYSPTEMDSVIQKFREENGEQATQELVECYRQFVMGMINKK